MSTLSLAARDCGTMLRRDLKHLVRYPSLTVMVLGLPIILLLLFVYVFGATLGAGLGGDRSRYADYVAPGILVLTLAGVAQATAITVAMDMTEGIVTRFRTMAIFRPSVLFGHVLGSLVQGALSVAVVFGVCLLTGFRPVWSSGRLLAAAGLMLLLALALTWLTVGLGLAARSVETASNSPNLLMLLPFMGSGFVPTASMPTPVRWFADHQPFTPVMETLRALLLGGPGSLHPADAVQAVVWCVSIALAAGVWSVRLYRRDPRPR